MSGRRLLVPEVIQTSAMDCGPACLTATLAGFGIHASYGRLREACQTDVDGTSIDQIEDAAVQLGLDAEQVMVPADYLMEPEAPPGILVVRLPNGCTHFVIVWRKYGRWVQCMDPAAGRRWTSRDQLLAEAYIHTQSVPDSAWREWAGSESFLRPCRRRLRAIGITRGEAERLLKNALQDASWTSLASMDAAARMVDSLVRASGLRNGREAASVFSALLNNPGRIPERYWCVRQDPASPGHLLFKGAVLVEVRGRRVPRPEPRDLPPELAAALAERPVHPGRHLWKGLCADGLSAPAVLVAVLGLAAAGTVAEAILLRGFLDVGRHLVLSGQRLWALTALLIFLVGLLLLETPLAFHLRRVSRKLECRLRLSFLRKIPRLSDRYFQSRLISDMAERSHGLHQLRLIPEIGADLLRSVFQLLFTVAGIVWFYPGSAIAAMAGAAAMVAIPLLAQPSLTERDLRVRNHVGALSRFYLDALLGLTAIRAHRSERPLRSEQEKLLAEWAGAAIRVQRLAVLVDALQFLVGAGIAVWLVLGHIAQDGGLGGVLLLAWWALSIPVLGQQIAEAAWQYPTLRNITLRYMEPLGAPEEPVELPAKAGHGALPGVFISIEGASVRASGHSILEDITLQIEPGSHVAIVGRSGGWLSDCPTWLARRSRGSRSPLCFTRLESLVNLD